MKSTLLVASIFSSLLSVSAFAAVNNGSNASRAPLPTSRPSEYTRFTKSDASSSLLANHIGSLVPGSIVAAPAETKAGAKVIATTPVARVDTAPRIAAVQR